MAARSLRLIVNMLDHSGLGCEFCSLNFKPQRDPLTKPSFLKATRWSFWCSSACLEVFRGAEESFSRVLFVRSNLFLNQRLLISVRLPEKLFSKSRHTEDRSDRRPASWGAEWGFLAYCAGANTIPRHIVITLDWIGTVACGVYGVDQSGCPKLAKRWIAQQYTKREVKTFWSVCSPDWTCHNLFAV